MTAEQVWMPQPRSSPAAIPQKEQLCFQMNLDFYFIERISSLIGLQNVLTV